MRVSCTYVYVCGGTSVSLLGLGGGGIRGMGNLGGGGMAVLASI